MKFFNFKFCKKTNLIGLFLDDDKSLQSLKFQIGDYLDISITAAPQQQNHREMRLNDRIDRGPPRRDRMNHRY